jgi:hypothetical protein
MMRLESSISWEFASFSKVCARFSSPERPVQYRYGNCPEPKMDKFRQQYRANFHDKPPALLEFRRKLYHSG